MYIGVVGGCCFVKTFKYFLNKIKLFQFEFLNEILKPSENRGCGGSGFMKNIFEQQEREEMKFYQTILPTSGSPCKQWLAERHVFVDSYYVVGTTD